MRKGFSSSYSVANKTVPQTKRSSWSCNEQNWL